MIRQPTSSTPFPTRRSSDLQWPIAVTRSSTFFSLIRPIVPIRKQSAWFNLRSEEHTSELQSHSDLVCRLLLEKKKRRRDKYTLYQHFKVTGTEEVDE